LAGALVGVIAMFLPQVMGTGSATMNTMLNANSVDFTIGLLLALVVAKLLATTISLGGGFVGGMFAPSLFVGAALGGAFGRIFLIVFGSTLNADPAAFAMAGMAAVMTGVIRTPITAVLLLFELTNDYKLILPIMLVTAVCLFVVERLAPDGIYHHALARKGVRLPRGRDIDLMQTVTVRAAMTVEPRTVPADLPASQLPAEFARTNTHGLLVTDPEGFLYGIVTLQDVNAARESGKLESSTAGDICTREVLTVKPDDPVSKALHLIGQHGLGRVPVVAEDNPRKIIGVLRRADIARAYELALQQRAEAQFRTDQVRLAVLSHAQVAELRVQPGSPADGKLLREVPWPSSSVVASIWRQNSTIAPHGETRLKAGDILTVVSVSTDHAGLMRLVSARPSAQSHSD
ncbi:MAG TPA: chloride channel protein, partial [Aggregatilineales bacterium]|nr:chloride channel protein [Aggregatilineales bacterium]